MVLVKAALVTQAGKLYMRAKEPEQALDVLEKGGLFSEAGEVAVRLKEFSRAASLFREAGEDPPAAGAAANPPGSDGQLPLL